jgi:hypothetical protein
MRRQSVIDRPSDQAVRMCTKRGADSRPPDSQREWGVEGVELDQHNRSVERASAALCTRSCPSGRVLQLSGPLAAHPLGPFVARSAASPVAVSLGALAMSSYAAAHELGLRQRPMPLGGGAAAGVIVAIPILSGPHYQYAGYDFRKGQTAKPTLGPSPPRQRAAASHSRRSTVDGERRQPAWSFGVRSWNSKVTEAAPMTVHSARRALERDAGR